MADGLSNLELVFPSNKPLTYSIFWDISIRVKLDPSHLQGGFRVSAVSNGCGGQVGRKKKAREQRENTAAVRREITLLSGHFVEAN